MPRFHRVRRRNPLGHSHAGTRSRHPGRLDTRVLHVGRVVVADAPSGLPRLQCLLLCKAGALPQASGVFPCAWEQGPQDVTVPASGNVSVSTCRGAWESWQGGNGKPSLSAGVKSCDSRGVCQIYKPASEVWKAKIKRFPGMIGEWLEPMRPSWRRWFSHPPLVLPVSSESRIPLLCDGSPESSQATWEPLELGGPPVPAPSLPSCGTSEAMVLVQWGSGGRGQRRVILSCPSTWLDIPFEVQALHLRCRPGAGHLTSPHLRERQESHNLVKTVKCPPPGVEMQATAMVTAVGASRHFEAGHTEAREPHPEGRAWPHSSAPGRIVSLWGHGAQAGRGVCQPQM